MSTSGQSRHFDRSPFASDISAETDTPGLGATSQIRQFRTWTEQQADLASKKGICGQDLGNILDQPDVVPREA